MSTYELIRNAKVEVKHIINDRKANIAEITINDKICHRFSPTSRVSKHLDVMSVEDLQGRLNGGTFFTVEDELVDWRDGAYNGFAHTDEQIGIFMDLLGYQRKDQLRFSHNRKGDENESPIVLRKVWSDNEIIVPGYAQGNEFQTQLSFVWNPFVKTINSAFDLVRLICTNGMVGLTSFLNTKVPLFNRHTEHLAIANKQIQNKVNHIVVNRIQQMAKERASVGELMLLEQHAFDRLYSPSPKQEGERERLMSLMSAVSPKGNLESIYKDNVFNDKNLAAQLPGHLSVYDAFNVATELRTHTSEVKKSSDNAIDKISNNFLFDHENKTVNTGHGPKLSVFSNPEQAYYGEVG